MSKKIAIVTGASSGFGMLSSMKLAEKGFHVIATMRDLNKRDQLQSLCDYKGVSKSIEYVQLDVTSETSINQFEEYIKKIGQVDVLVNNAGYASAGFVEEVPVEQYRKQFETNVFGLIAVTQKVIPLMRSRNQGTIINMSSISGLLGFPGMSPYVSSKFALEGFSESLRLELKPFGIDVFLIEPGSYDTNIWSTGKEIAEKSLDEASPYYSFMKRLENGIEEGKRSFGDPNEIATLISDIALGKKKEFRYPMGNGIKTMSRIKKILPWSWVEKTIIKRFT